MLLQNTLPLDSVANTPVDPSGQRYGFLLVIALALALFFLVRLLRRPSSVMPPPAPLLSSGSRGARQPVSPLQAAAITTMRIAANPSAPASPAEPVSPPRPIIPTPLPAPAPPTRAEAPLPFPKPVTLAPAAPSPQPAPLPSPEELRVQVKYIGYQPVNIFAQTEPLHFPYVLMPAKPGCVIKFPRKGRAGRRGHTEAAFFAQLQAHFQQAFQVYNDRFLLIREGVSPYEPDFVLIDETNGLNLFLDIEVDEPYEGTNDLATRQPMHFRYADTNRNNVFRSRGWVVVRFAEIQVHQQPTACCRLVAEVVASLNPGFVVPSALQSAPDVAAVPQWTREQAQQWSQNKYREGYLGIEKFGEVSAPERSAAVLESEIGKQEEAMVHEEPAVIIPKAPVAPPAPAGLLSEAVRLQQYVSFHYEGQPTVTKPAKYEVVTGILTAYCYVKNEDRAFQLAKMSALRVKPNFYSARLGKPALTGETVRALVQVAIRNGKYIRMSYTTSSWNAQGGETSLRTISDVQRSVDVLSADRVNGYNLSNNFHISAHCHKRDDQRTFHYDRIGEIAILDL